MSYEKIADRLNCEGVLSPSAYKKSKGMNYFTLFEKYEQTKWYSATVEKIIKTKYEQVHQNKGKENNHEAIITRDEYNRANVVLKGGRRNINDKYCGRLFCGDCGQPMVRRVNKWKGKETVYYICSTNNKGKGCSRHSIRGDELQNIKLNVGEAQIIVTEKGDSVIIK